MQKLFEAIRAGDREGVEALVEADPSLAIFAAAIQGDTVAIETLLAANRPLVSAVSSDGWTPLHLAAHFGKQEAVRLLLNKGAKADARSTIHNDYPEVDRPGSFPLGEVSYGSAFATLVEQMRSDEFRNAFEEKFSIDLTNRPDMITVRGRCSEKDGKIHTDSETKIITILIYMNPGWESAGGRLRLLRSGNNLDDMILEVPPTEGTLLAFRRSNNSWHGHKPFSGPRRVIQFNWVTSEAVVRREQNRHRFSAWMKKLRGAMSGEKKAA